MATLYDTGSYLGLNRSDFLTALSRRNTSSGDDITFVRPELQGVLHRYGVIQDCLQGEERIKAKGVEYLPKPDAEEVGLENEVRYQAYVQRAIFYNVTGRTHQGLVGQVFLRDPSTKNHPLLDPVIQDADGLGLSLNQLAKRAVQYLVAYGRCGIFTDYPNFEGMDTSIFTDEEMRPFMKVFAPWDIINWRTGRRGGKTILTKVVLREVFESHNDKFSLELRDRFYVLYLDEFGEFVVEVYTDLSERHYYQLVGSGKPLNSQGMPFTEINFKFIGADTNDPDVDPPPLYDLAVMNIGHYRNSADYQESCFFAGQPTLVVDGLDETWATQLLGGQIGMGSRRAILLPEGAKAYLLQATSNSQPYESMRHLELQMVASGAKILEQARVQRTATQTRFDVNTENSTLATISDNASNAFTASLKICEQFLGIDPNTELEFELNRDFELDTLSPEKIAQIVNAISQGILSWEEGRELFRHSGLTDQTDEKAKQSIADWMAEQIELERKRNPMPAPNTNNENNEDSSSEATDEEGGEEDSA